MYVPTPFALPDPGQCHDLIERHSFGVLISTDGGRPLATHLPFLLDRERGDKGTLIAHMARANTHWRHLSDGGAEALAIFAGPHGYISPRWYAEGAPAVPTWNYVVVHAWGRPKIIESGERTRWVVERLADKHESGVPRPWSVAGQPADFVASMVRAIVAFEMPITTLEGKAKLSQNRSPADRDRVRRALTAKGNAEAVALASAMTRLGEPGQDD